MNASLDYGGLVARHLTGRPEDRDRLGFAVTKLWMRDYARVTAWTPDVVEIEYGTFVYLFDRAPATETPAVPRAEARVVGVWGASGAAPSPRDRSRQSGFLPHPARWSGAGYDRGHFIAHSLGGGMDINFFPQARHVNRGSSSAGRRWRAVERRLSAHPGALLFVRPIYSGPGWTPAFLEIAAVIEGRVYVETCDNTPDESVSGSGGIRTLKARNRP